MKRAINYLSIGIMLLAAGCSVVEHEFVFNADKTPVNVAVDSCSFIDSVDGIKIDNSMREEGRLILDSGTIECGSLKTNQLGRFEVAYEYDNQIYKHTIDVVDEEAPLIHTQDEYEVEVNNDYFDLYNRVTFSDNYDLEIYKEIEGYFDISTPGDYKLKAIARDSSGNEASKEFVVHVIEEEKEIVEVPIYIPSNPSESGSSPIENKESSASEPSDNNETNSNTPFINGVKDITVSINTSLNDLVYMLGSGISSSSSLTVDYSNVNLSVPGQYAVWYYGSDGAAAQCTVTVQ